MTVNAHPKHKTHRDPKYLAWIRTLHCWYRPYGNCSGNVEAHHIRRIRWGAGISQKPHDYVAVPRCKYHHDPMYEENVELEIIDNLLEYFT